MRIVAINGSHRGRRGFTQVLLERMKAGAEEGGAEFSTIVLAERKLSRCLGCEACQAAGARLRCVFDGRDDVEDIFAEMRKADILVFATPVYVFAMSSLLKSLLERINSTCDTGDIRVSRSGLVFHQIDAELCSKPFVLVAPFGNIDAETAQSVLSYFRSFSRFMDAPMLAALPRSGAFILEEAVKTAGAALSPVMSTALGAFLEAGRDLAKRGRISTAIILRATRSVIPMPPPVRALMIIKPLRGRLLAAAKASGALRIRTR